jgi:tetratricopeptide (TPR) repeat protein
VIRTVAATLLLAAAALTAGGARAHMIAIEAKGKGGKELLYLPNGKYLKLVSLGHAPLVADFIYLWAIQYYSDYDRTDRYRYVEHVFGDVIGELDPAYEDPVWLGAMILTTEAGDVNAGLRLLDAGFARNPRAWILPYLAGWECERANRFEDAAAYFDRAAAVPGAPPQIYRLKAGMTARAGNLREAIERWRDVLRDPRNNDGAKAIATSQIRSLTVQADIHELEAAIVTFRERHGRAPARLDDLLRDGIVTALPEDPDGHAYVYDSETGKVTSEASRVLGS